MPNIKDILLLGLVLRPIIAIGFAVVIFNQWEQTKNKTKYQPIKWGVIIALLGAELFCALAFLFDYLTVVDGDLRYLSWYLLGSIISSTVGAIAVPFVFFYKVKE